MLKCCAHCKSFYFPDTDDVSGFYCRILENELINIKHVYCDKGCVYFKFSWLNFIFGV
jgi:hypothetical protein